MWEWIILVIVLLILIIRVKKRGFFWRAKDGTQLTFKQFLKRWKSGVANATPVQQTRIVLISFMPMFAGIVWGIAITFLGKVYWMTLILIGSLPITGIQFLSNIQKYKIQKRVQEEMDKLNNVVKKPKRKKK